MASRRCRPPQPACHHPDHHGVVAAQDQVEQDDLPQTRGELGLRLHEDSSSCTLAAKARPAARRPSLHAWARLPAPMTLDGHSPNVGVCVVVATVGSGRARDRMSDTRGALVGTCNIQRSDAFLRLLVLSLWLPLVILVVTAIRFATLSPGEEAGRDSERGRDDCAHGPLHLDRRAAADSGSYLSAPARPRVGLCVRCRAGAPDGLWGGDRRAVRSGGNRALPGSSSRSRHGSRWASPPSSSANRSNMRPAESV